MGKALQVGRKQARPTGDGPATANEDEDDVPSSPMDEEKRIISSSHPLMPSSAVSLFFMLSFELTPCDFLIVGALNRLSSDRLARLFSSVNVFW